LIVSRCSLARPLLIFRRCVGSIRRATLGLTSHSCRHSNQRLVCCELNLVMVVDSPPAGVFSCSPGIAVRTSCRVGSMPSKTSLTLYTAGTPNGWKVSILLEELGIPYHVHAIAMAKNEQKEPWYFPEPLFVCLPTHVMFFNMHFICCILDPSCDHKIFWQHRFIKINPNGRIPAIGNRMILVLHLLFQHVFVTRQSACTSL